MRFVKIEACGNDYIYLDMARNEDVCLEALSSERIRGLCDRHRGVGADGVVLLDNISGWRMRMFNADGTRGRTCGNALRSIAKWIDMTYGAAFPLQVETDAGRVLIEKTIDMDKVRYAVHLGVARIIGVADTAFGVVHLVDVGNKHAVLRGLPQDVDSAAEAIRAACGAGGLNVECYDLEAPQRLSMRVNEYGTGRTLACGSGACAVAFAACAEGGICCGVPVSVEMEGGSVDVTCHKDGKVVLTGDAHIVYEGEWIDR